MNLSRRAAPPEESQRRDGHSSIRLSGPSGRHQPSVVLAPAGTDRGGMCLLLVPPRGFRQGFTWTPHATRILAGYGSRSCRGGFAAGERSARRAALPCPEGEVPG